MRTLCTLFIFCSYLLCSAQVVHNLSSDPIPICQERFEFEEFKSFFEAPVNALENSCLGDMSLLSSVWLSVDIESAGDFAFNLAPNSEFDDIDFVLYKSNDMSSTQEFTLMRCMATGLRLDQSAQSQVLCKGVTGLRPLSSDTHEEVGCGPSDDNFLASLQAQKGDRFLILVTNYDSDSGFRFELTGTAKLSDLSCQETTSDFLVKSEELNISNLRPNPVVDRAFFDIEMTRSTEVRLQVARIDGSVVYDREMFMPAGKYQLTVPAKNLSPGNYIARVMIGQKEFVTKFIKTQVN